MKRADPLQRLALAGLAVLGAGIAGLATWAALAPLSGAIVALSRAKVKGGVWPALP